MNQAGPGTLRPPDTITLRHAPQWDYIGVITPGRMCVRVLSAYSSCVDQPPLLLASLGRFYV